jgi:hypothetical protein
MAIDELNEKYKTENITIKFSFKDTQASNTEGALVAVDLYRNAFNKDGVHGVIGPKSNLVSTAMSNILDESDLAQVGHLADTSYLSHYSSISSHYRVNPSSSFQANALVDLIYKTFNWKRVLVVYSSTSSGLDALDVFKHQAALYGLEIIGTLQMTPTLLKTPASEKRYADSIDNIKILEARIYVLLLDNESVAQEFIDTAGNTGLINSDSIILGNSEISSKNLWNFTNPASSVRKSSYKALNDALGGYIGITETHTDWMYTSKGKDFITRYRKRPPTIREINGVSICSGEMDDDGNKLWQRNLTTGVTCAGDDYSTYGNYASATGYEAYIHDATTTMVEGIISYCKVNYPTANGFSIPNKISGRDLVNHIVENFSMPLLTGTVKFSTGIEELNMYGYGDREYNIRYSVVNFNASTNLISGFQMNRIGTWSSEGDSFMLKFIRIHAEIHSYMQHKFIHLCSCMHMYSFMLKFIRICINLSICVHVCICISVH